MPRKAAQSRTDTLAEVRRHAFALFGRYGYEGVSIGDIAREAGLSKGALYWHFEDKGNLYLDCQAALHAMFNQYIFAPMRASQDGVARVFMVFTGLGALLNDPRVKHGIGGYWHMPQGSETARILEAQRAFEAACFETMRETMRLGVSQGRFNFRDDLDDMARAIIALVEAVVLPLRQQTPEEMHQILGVLARTLLRAYAKEEELLNLTRKL